MPPESSFDELYTRELTSLVKFVQFLGADEFEANDAAQEAMLELYTRWDTGEIRHPRAYLRRSAHTAFLRSAVKDRRQENLPDRLPRQATAPDPIEKVIRREETELLIARLQQLPLEQRTVVAFHLDGFSNKEIAEQYGKIESTVRSNLRHGLRKLEQQFTPDSIPTGRRRDHGDGLR